MLPSCTNIDDTHKRFPKGEKKNEASGHVNNLTKLKTWTDLRDLYLLLRTNSDPFPENQSINAVSHWHSDSNVNDFSRFKWIQICSSNSANQFQEIPQGAFTGKEVMPGPILRIWSEKSIEFQKPLSIQLPMTVRDSCVISDQLGLVRILYQGSSCGQRQWTDITDRLEIPPSCDGNVITFSNKHFSRYDKLTFFNLFSFYFCNHKRRTLCK